MEAEPGGVLTVEELSAYSKIGAPKHDRTVLFGNLKCGGLLFDRHDPPHTRRFGVYHCSAVCIR